MRRGHVGCRGSGRATRRRDGLQEHETGRGATEGARHGDHVPDVRRGPGDRSPRGIADQRHVDDPAPGRYCGIAAYDHHVVLRGERLDTRVESLGLVETDGLRKGQRNQRPPRPAAHRGDVRQVDGQRLPADVGWRGPAAPEMYVLDEEIGRRQEHASGVRFQDCAVVADADPDPWRLPGRPPDDLDQAPLGRRSGAHPGPLRKSLRSCLLSTVWIDSGWNWPPSTGSRRWRRPMISPSSAQAVTSSASGTVSRRTAREWYRVATIGFPRPAETPRPSWRIAAVFPCLWHFARATVAP